RATLALLDADLDWDPAAMTTRAEKSAKGWTLSGTKRFVPWAHVANVLLIPARAPEGPSLFLVDPASAGLKLSPVQGMDLATRWVHVDMDRVPVVPEALLGAPGQAAPLLSSLLRRGAVGAAAEMLGAARRCLDMAVGYAWEYDLHIYFKRAKALESMYGDVDYHREQIVRRAAR